MPSLIYSFYERPPLLGLQRNTLSRLALILSLPNELLADIFCASFLMRFANSHIPLRSWFLKPCNTYEILRWPHLYFGLTSTSLSPRRVLKSQKLIFEDPRLCRWIYASAALLQCMTIRLIVEADDRTQH
jgi:hypothetical protein